MKRKVSLACLSRSSSLLLGSSEFEGKVENMTFNTLQYPGAVPINSQNTNNTEFVLAVFILVLILYAV